MCVCEFENLHTRRSITSSFHFTIYMRTFVHRLYSISCAIRNSRTTQRRIRTGASHTCTSETIRCRQRLPPHHIFIYVIVFSYYFVRNTNIYKKATIFVWMAFSSLLILTGFVSNRKTVFVCVIYIIHFEFRDIFIHRSEK